MTLSMKARDSARERLRAYPEITMARIIFISGHTRTVWVDPGDSRRPMTQRKGEDIERRRLRGLAVDACGGRACSPNATAHFRSTL